MMNQNNNIQGYKPNIGTFICKYVLGAPLSEEEIKAIAALTEEEQMELTVEVISGDLKKIKDLNTMTLVAAQIYGKVFSQSQNYNIEATIKSKTFLLNKQLIENERAKQKGISR